MAQAVPPITNTTEATTEKEQPQEQWIQINSISSFTTKWSLFQYLNTAFGNVVNVQMDEEKRSSRILFSNAESAKQCVDSLTANPILDGECIGIGLCADPNVRTANGTESRSILQQKLRGIHDRSLVDRVKFSAQSLPQMTPLQICKFHAKLLRLLSSSSSADGRGSGGSSSSIIVTEAFSSIGIDAYVFSEHFAAVNAVQPDDFAFSDLVSNIKLFGRGPMIKCHHGSFYQIWRSMSQHIVYLDAFMMNRSRIRWDDACPDIAYCHGHSTSYLSALCNDLHGHNRSVLAQQGPAEEHRNGNGNAVPLMLIAVKVPKHFVVAEFRGKVKQCHILVADFRFHKLMVLDYLHSAPELRSLEFKARNKRHDLGFHQTVLFQSEHTLNAANHRHHAAGPPLKRRRLSGHGAECQGVEVTEKGIGERVRALLRQSGFRRFGAEHARSFREKLRAQIVSKQLIREKVADVDLRSAFRQITDIEAFRKRPNDGDVDGGDGVREHDRVWMAPHIVGPRYVIYATSQWMTVLDEDQNMHYHPAFNAFYQKILIGQSEDGEPLKSVTVIDGQLIPSHYFGEMDPRNLQRTPTAPPLQFWISDVLSHRNNAAAVMMERFKFLVDIARSYRAESQFMQRSPISIHSLHFEAYQNMKNALKFIKPHQDTTGHYKKCFVYANNEGHRYAIDGFIAIKDQFPCTVHDRAKYSDRCVLWKCDFDAQLTSFMHWKRSQGQLL